LKSDSVLEEIIEYSYSSLVSCVSLLFLGRL